MTFDNKPSGQRPRKAGLSLRVFLIVAMVLTLWATVPARAQECAPPAISANSESRNIFSPEQESIIGELTYQKMLSDTRFVKDPQLAAYLNTIGDRLIRQLPESGLKFQFHIVDLPDVDAFNAPGGYVFVSRKLIAFARSEDELAGVIAHELGHAVAHHSAVQMSVLFKSILNVTKLGDRKDVTEKFNLVIERQKTKAVFGSSRQESEAQLTADRIGLFALVAAGYPAGSFTAFYDRMAETQGKTGNWFSDLFGALLPEEKRLREMSRLSEKLPASCRDNRLSHNPEDFLRWQAGVISFREHGRVEELPGLLWRKELAPKLRSDVSHLEFSYDGTYLLAQDDFAITVLQRQPLQVLFQIPTEDADEAMFTPDNRFVVFSTENLRFEKWSIAEGKPIEIRELAVRRNCLEHELSPDGRYLACIDSATNLRVFETSTSEKVWEKKAVYTFSFYEYLVWEIAALTKGVRDVPFFHIEFSPDGRILVVSRSTFYWSKDALLALDMNTLKPVRTGGELVKATRRPFLFLDSGRIFAMVSEKPEDSGIFSFPDGKRLATIPFGASELIRSQNPDIVTTRFLGDSSTGIFDISRKAYVGTLHRTGMAFWKDLTAYQSVNGQLLVAEVHYNVTTKIAESVNPKTIDIPVGPLGSLAAAGLSGNFQWLMASSKSRGAMWELTSGERKLFVRGFRGALVADNGEAVGEFPKIETANHSLVLLNPSTNTLNTLREISDRGASQYGQFLLVRKSLVNTAKNENKTATGSPNPVESQDAAEPYLAGQVRFEVHNLLQNKLIWSRDFPKDAPRFEFNEFSGRLIFHWALGSDTGKARLAADAALARRARELGNKDDDFLVEIVDTFLGQTIGTVLLETGQGSFGIRSSLSEGDWFILHDSENRILVYSMKEGKLRHRFFGENAAVNPAKNQIVIQNYPGELIFYDLESGDAQGRLTLSSGATFLRFSLEGNKLFVLSREQTAYAFDLEKVISTSAPIPN